MKSINTQLRSVLLCLEAHPDNEQGSEFEDRIEDLKEVIEKIKGKWKIEKTEVFYHKTNRFYSLKYQETTFWYNTKTMERKETFRTQFLEQNELHKLEDWAKNAEYRKYLNP